MTLIPEEKLKNSQGKMVTSGLFVDLGTSEYNFFCLSRKDRDGFVSFPASYLKYTLEDPTEYTFAMTFFGNWEHWARLLDRGEIRDIVSTLRVERDMAIQSKAVKALFEEVNNNGKSAFSSAKLLLEKGWMDKDKLPKIDPKKVAEDKKKSADIASIKERLQLSVVTKK